MKAAASGEACGCYSASSPDSRSASLRRALRLEYLTVGWNVIEGLIAVVAARSAGSVALLGFGLDSFVECTSALVMIWRLRAERDRKMSADRLDHLERRARKAIAATLFLLAAYVTFDALATLWTADRPAFSSAGATLLVVSIGVMRGLARAKRRAAHALGSAAMEADALQSTACWWLSVAALGGVGLNGVLGWWWADPLATLVIAALIVSEAREAWRGKACC